MPVINAVVDCPVHASFRVAQVAGLFDVPVGEKSRREFAAEVPGLDEPWQVGAIVGPSGAGKTTLARAAFGEALYQSAAWSPDRAVIDGFGDAGIKEITAALTAVGFSSPPAWIRPFHVLSNGERFRCELARALLSPRELIVFDEFTSVVDRTVAKIGSAALAKAIRRTPGRRFVAVTCHYDVAEWLAADWVLDMGAGQLARGRLRRPDIALEIFRADRAAWRVFGPHHYLSAQLHRAARCYLATWEDEPVALVAVLPTWGYRGYLRISRIVVLPDYQGLGIARAVLSAVCRHLLAEGARRVGLVTGHPSMIQSLRTSRQWRCEQVARAGSRHHGVAARNAHSTNSEGRCVVRFVYVEKAESRKRKAEE